MKAGFNKNRYRNFFIGMSVSCGLTLFAFTYKVDYTVGEIVIIEPSSDPIGVAVMSVQFEKPIVKKQEPKRVKRSEPFQINAKIKLVDNDVSIMPKLSKPQPQAITVAMPSLIGVKPALSKVETVVDQKPEFPGGSEALRAFLRDNLQYPQDSEYFEEEGLVRVMFIVDEDGNISDLKVIKNELRESAAVETKRVIMKMPRWKPAIKNGEPVKTYFIQPFQFRLF